MRYNNALSTFVIKITPNFPATLIVVVFLCVYILTRTILANILKTEATQTKLLPAQTSTNEAQTIETVLGEFGACGGLSDLRKRLLNIILIS